MPINISERLLDALWNALQAPLPRVLIRNEAARVARLVERKWLHQVDIGDLLEDWDERLRGIDLFELAKTFELHVPFVYGLDGRKTQRSFTGFKMISSVGAAALLIYAERLGFRVDPTIMVSAVLPSLKGLKQATGAELSVLQFSVTRHKGAPVTLAREGAGWTCGSSKQIRTDTGYRAIAHFDAGGTICRLEVAAPRHRRSPEPVLACCPDCGMTYMKGDPDDGARHRQTHSRHMAIVAPRRHPRAAAVLAEGWDGRVDAGSPPWMHSEVHRRAVLFKREFGYDFVQWSSNGERDGTALGFLFPGELDGTIRGACCFRWREHKNATPSWALSWIWIAPPFRRCGILSSWWPMFLREFGRFHVERPLSEAMQAFLDKHGDPGSDGTEKLRVQTETGNQDALEARG